MTRRREREAPKHQQAAPTPRKPEHPLLDNDCDCIPCRSGLTHIMPCLGDQGTTLFPTSQTRR
jgi:hypothetical protein